MAAIRTAKQAARWVDAVGLALVFRKADMVLPSLWEAVAGEGEPFAVRERDGTFVRWSDGMSVVWRVKDELPERRLACVGRHLGGGAAALVAPRVVPLLYALTGRDGSPDDFRAELDGLELEVAEAALGEGPLTPPQLRTLTGAAKQDVERTVLRLGRRLVLTHAGLVDQDAGWGSIALDVFARRWPPGTLPPEEEARRGLARLVLAAAGELSAADLAGAIGWRRKLAAEVLDEVAESRDGGGFRIWRSL